MRRSTDLLLSLRPLAAVLGGLLGCSAGAADGDPGFGVTPGAGGAASGAGGQMAAGVGGSGSGGAGNAGLGGSGALGGASGSGGSSGAAGTSGATGAGGTGSTPPAAGRAGSELCPPGPFASPLPATPQASKVVMQPQNNFFNWEGAVWIGDSLYWSEINGGQSPPPARIHRYTPSSSSFTPNLIQNTGSNGLGVDATGNLVAATHDLGAIATFALATGARGQFGGPSAQTFDSARFNSPNDLVLRNDGNLYFTDPTSQAPSPNPQDEPRVYRISPQGVVSVVDDNINNPNGITLSPDGSTLYVSSGSGSGLRRYTLDSAGVASAGVDVSLSPALNTPDGMAVDCAGNVYTTEHNLRQIRVISAQGQELGHFGDMQMFDNNLTNLAFGGPDRSTLFVTTLTQSTQGGIYIVPLNVPGLPY